MNISELIFELEKLRAKYGDLPVYMQHEWISNIEVKHSSYSEFTWGINGETDFTPEHVEINIGAGEVLGRYLKKK